MMKERSNNAGNLAVESNNMETTTENKEEITITPSPSIDGSSRATMTSSSSLKSTNCFPPQKRNCHKNSNKPPLSPQNKKNAMSNGGFGKNYMQTYTNPTSVPSVPTTTRNSPRVHPLRSQQQQQQHQNYYYNNYCHPYYGYYYPPPPPSPLSPSPQYHHHQGSPHYPFSPSAASSPSSLHRPTTPSRSKSNSSSNNIDGFKKLLQQKESTLHNLRMQLEVKEKQIQNNCVILEDLKSDVIRYTKNHDYELELLKFTLPPTFHNQLQNMKLLSKDDDPQNIIQDDDVIQQQQHDDDIEEDSDKIIQQNDDANIEGMDKVVVIMKNQQQQDDDDDDKEVIEIATTTNRHDDYVETITTTTVMSCSNTTAVTTTIQSDDDSNNKNSSDEPIIRLEPILEVPTPLSSIISAKPPSLCAQEEKEKGIEVVNQEQQQEEGSTTEVVAVDILEEKNDKKKIVLSDDKASTSSSSSVLQEQQQQQQQQQHDQRNDHDYKEDAANKTTATVDSIYKDENIDEELFNLSRREKKVEEEDRKAVINAPTLNVTRNNNVSKEIEGGDVAVSAHRSDLDDDDEKHDVTTTTTTTTTFSNDKHTTIFGYSYENVDASTGEPSTAVADYQDENFDPVSYCNSLLLKKKILKRKISQQDENDGEEHYNIDDTTKCNSTISLVAVNESEVLQMQDLEPKGNRIVVDNNGGAVQGLKPNGSKGDANSNGTAASTPTSENPDDEQDSFDPTSYYDALKKQQEEEANVPSNPASAAIPSTPLTLKNEVAVPDTTGEPDEAKNEDWNDNNRNDNNLPAYNPSSSFSPYAKVTSDPHYLSLFSPHSEVADPMRDCDTDPIGSSPMIGFGTENNHQIMSASNRMPAIPAAYPQNHNFQIEEVAQPIEAGDEDDEEDRKPAAVEFPPSMTTGYATIQYDFDDDESYNFYENSASAAAAAMPQRQLQNNGEERTGSSQHSDDSEKDKKPAAVNIYYPTKTRASIKNDFFEEDNNLNDKSEREQQQQLLSTWKQRQHDLPNQAISTKIENGDETNGQREVGNSFNSSSDLDYGYSTSSNDPQRGGSLCTKFGDGNNGGNVFSASAITSGTSTASCTEDRHGTKNGGKNNQADEDDIGRKPPATTTYPAAVEENLSTSSERRVSYGDNRDASDETKKAASAYDDAADLSRSPKMISSFSSILMSGDRATANGIAADIADKPSPFQNDSSKENEIQNTSITESSRNVATTAKTDIYCDSNQKSHGDKERYPHFNDPLSPTPSNNSQSVGSNGSNNSHQWQPRTSFHVPPATPKSDIENSKLKSQKNKIDVTLYESAYSPRRINPLVSTTKNNSNKSKTATIPSSPLDASPTTPPTTAYADANRLLLANDKDGPDENAPASPNPKAYDLDGDVERQKVVDKKILDPYGDEGIYTGVIFRSSGMPHGLGKMHYVEDGRIYDGDWQHGRWHGYGYATFPNGDSYQGEYRSDQREGRGIYRWNDGRVYNGFFVDDRRHGRGSFSWPDGAQYEGEFAYGKRSGQGKYTFASPNGDAGQNSLGDGGFYDGGWKDGKYNGYGVCRWGDGRQYRGEWENGMANGHGIETYPNGIIRHDGLWKDDMPLREGEGYASAIEAPTPEGGACYLVYEPDSSGRLVEVFSKTPIRHAIGRWTPAPRGEKRIAKFKFEQNLGKNVLIGNCSAGVVGRKNYASGWCQYVRSAKAMQGEVILWNPVVKGLAVDVYLYTNDSSPAHQTVKLLQGVPTRTDNVLAVACIPKHTRFYEGMAVDMLKWLADGSTYGASSKFQ